MEKYEFIVGDVDGGLRLDVFLARRDISLSRSQAVRLIDEGRVQVGDKAPVKVSYRLRAGEVVVLERSPATAYHVSPENIPLDVVFEDDVLMVVNKPAGMVVHPAVGNASGTLVNAVLFHCPALSGIGGVARPGIVHRLDKGTSGLIVVAKTDEAHRGLAAQFKAHQIEKHYLALVLGQLTEQQGVIDAPVGRHVVERKKMSTSSRRGKAALTLWRVEDLYVMATLLDVEIRTGRTHQIRVHLASLGHPVVGDTVYGNPKRIHDIRDPLIRARLSAMDRQALHACSLRFFHPLEDREMCFSAPMPVDMAGLCAFLRKYGSGQDGSR
jgi:23S rRNA pseudouridine1911/1915/1917 synthase